MFFASAVIMAVGQQSTGANSHPGAISGTVTDVNDHIIPGANISLQSSLTGEKRSTVSGDNGSYTFGDLRPGVTYQVTIGAVGFVPWTSPTFTVAPDQLQFLTGSRLQLAGEAASVTVYASSEDFAAEQIKSEIGRAHV